MDELTLLSWNIRGIGNDVARANLKYLIWEIEPLVLMIQETKSKEWSDYNSESLWRSNNYGWSAHNAIIYLEAC